MYSYSRSARLGVSETLDFLPASAKAKASNHQFHRSGNAGTSGHLGI
jgi:hypothetical protein